MGEKEVTWVKQRVNKSKGPHRGRIKVNRVIMGEKTETTDAKKGKGVLARGKH